MLVGKQLGDVLSEFNDHVSPPDFARSQRALGIELIWQNAARLYPNKLNPDPDKEKPSLERAAQGQLRDSNQKKKDRIRQLS